MKIPSAMKHGAAIAACVFAYIAPAHSSAVTVGTIYQEGSNRESVSPPTTAQCQNIAFCHILFNIVPSGKQLLITDVSCHVVLFGGAAQQVTAAEIVTFSTSGQATDRAHGLLLSSSVATGSTAINQYVTATRQILKAGERPVVRFVSTELVSWNPRCSISGKVGNPPE